MNRPKIEADLSNVDEVFEYFDSHRPSINSRFLKGFHDVMSMLFKPNVVFAPGNEDNPGAEEKISGHLTSGNPTALVMTHLSALDAPNVTAGVNQHEALKDIVGNTVIDARAGLFNTLVGSIIERGQGWPVYGKKDLAKHYKKMGFSESEIQVMLKNMMPRIKKANARLRQPELEAVNNDGVIYAAHLEGTRNRGQQTEVQKIKNGVKYFLASVDNADEAGIICMGLYYGGEKLERLGKLGRVMNHLISSPTIYVDFMDAPPVEVVNGRLSETLQGCVEGAIANRPHPEFSPATKASLAALGIAAAAVSYKLEKSN